MCECDCEPRHECRRVGIGVASRRVACRRMERKVAARRDGGVSHSDVGQPTAIRNHEWEARVARGRRRGCARTRDSSLRPDRVSSSSSSSTRRQRLDFRYPHEKRGIVHRLVAHLRITCTAQCTLCSVQSVHYDVVVVDTTWMRRREKRANARSARKNAVREMRLE